MEKEWERREKEKDRRGRGSAEGGEGVGGKSPVYEAYTLFVLVYTGEHQENAREEYNRVCAFTYLAEL